MEHRYQILSSATLSLFGREGCILALFRLVRRAWRKRKPREKNDHACWWETRRPHARPFFFLAVFFRVTHDALSLSLSGVLSCYSWATGFYYPINLSFFCYHHLQYIYFPCRSCYLDELDSSIVQFDSLDSKPLQSWRVGKPSRIHWRNNVLIFFSVLQNIPDGEGGPLANI